MTLSPPWLGEEHSNRVRHSNIRVWRTTFWENLLMRTWPICNICNFVTVKAVQCINIGRRNDRNAFLGGTILRKSQDRNTGLFLPFSVSLINTLPIMGASYFFSPIFGLPGLGLWLPKKGFSWEWVPIFAPSYFWFLLLSVLLYFWDSSGKPGSSRCLWERERVHVRFPTCDSGTFCSSGTCPHTAVTSTSFQALKT